MPNYGNPQSLNRYSYVINNPLRYTDPTGHMFASDDYKDSDGKCGKNDKGCNDLVKRIKIKRDKEREDRESERNRYCYAHPTECGVGGNGGGTTVDEILSKYPNFNPFTPGFENNPDGYRGSNAEAMDAEFLEWYKSQGIDIDFYASQGLPNPLNHNQVPKELVARLPLLANDTETRFFTMKMMEATGNEFSSNMLNYEANYVYSLMRTHPDVLAVSVVDYNSEENMYREILDQWIDKGAPAPAIPPPGASE